VSRGTAATITVNGEVRAWEEGTVETLLRALGLDPDRPGIAVAVNEEIVRRHDWGSHALRTGDRVEIVGAAQGG
jgi:sulfur carrier protein